MRDLTPRPTEYKGIVYRSKCEAMFAMWLDLRNSTESMHVEYEPDWAEIGDYVPDFVVAKAHPVTNGGRLVTFETWIEFIEYKPSRPTFTYIADVAKKIRSVIFRECSGPNVRVGAFVYFGSVYHNDRGIVGIGKHEGTPVSGVACDWLHGYEREIREYRFDLEVAT